MEYRRLALNCLLLRLNPNSLRGSTVSHVDDPFSAANSSARWVFWDATSFIPLTLFSLSFALFSLTSCCADVIREGSGNWCACDTICATRGVVTLTDDTYSRCASSHGFPRPSPPKRTGNDSISLSSWLHCRSVRAGISICDIAFSNGSSRSWISGMVLMKYVHRCFRPNVYAA